KSTYGESVNGALQLRLVGNGEANRGAVGARVHVYADLNQDGTVDVPGEVQIRELTAGAASHNQDSSMLNIGLGLARRIKRLEIHWPTPVTQLPRKHVVENIFIPSNGLLRMTVAETEELGFSV